MGVRRRGNRHQHVAGAGRGEEDRDGLGAVLGFDADDPPGDAVFCQQTLPVFHANEELPVGGHLRAMGDRRRVGGLCHSIEQPVEHYPTPPR